MIKSSHIIDIKIQRGLGCNFSRSWLKNAVNAVLSAEKIAEPVSVGLLITDDRQIHYMNRRYRGIDRPTDVLSFALTEKATDAVDIDFPPEQDGINNLGEIVISLPRVIDQANKYKVNIEDEMVFVIVHGMLHLLGYNHEDELDTRRMRLREKKIMSAIKKKAKGKKQG